jgi:hypothetical protein
MGALPPDYPPILTVVKHRLLYFTSFRPVSICATSRCTIAYPDNLHFPPQIIRSSSKILNKILSLYLRAAYGPPRRIPQLLTMNCAPFALILTQVVLELTRVVLKTTDVVLELTTVVHCNSPKL